MKRKEMKLGIHTHTDAPEYKEKRSVNVLPIIRAGILAALLMVPNIRVQSESGSKEQNQKAVASYRTPQKGISVDINESIEVSDEELFKSTFAKAISPINSLQDIPAGGIVLSYPSSTTLPKTIDFFPKKMIADKLPYSIVKIGDKMFTVTPDMGFEVDDMYLDATEFTVVVTMDSRFGEVSKTTSKDKKSELGTYLWKIYSEGADGRYLGSTVAEIPKASQKLFLEAYNKLNK